MIIGPEYLYTMLQTLFQNSVSAIEILNVHHTLKLIVACFTNLKPI